MSRRVLSISGEVRIALPGRADATEPVEGAISYYPVKFDLSQYSALIVPCARWHYLVGCGVFQAGYVYFKTPLDSGTSPTWGLGPRLGFEVPFARRFTVFGFGEALFTPQPASVAYTLPRPTDPDGPVANTQWRQSIVSGFFGVGFARAFGGQGSVERDGRIAASGSQASPHRPAFGAVRSVVDKHAHR